MQHACAIWLPPETKTTAVQQHARVSWVHAASRTRQEFNANEVTVAGFDQEDRRKRPRDGKREEREESGKRVVHSERYRERRTQRETQRKERAQRARYRATETTSRRETDTHR